MFRQRDLLQIELFIFILTRLYVCIESMEQNKNTTGSEYNSSTKKDNSAHLARIRHLRERAIEMVKDQKLAKKETQQKQSTTKSGENKGKTKRYKCFLVDDDDDKGEVYNQQNSYFAGFQQRRFEQKGSSDILGWEEGVKRSEGAGQQRYVYASSSSKGTSTTPAPIIEYLEDYDEEGGSTTLIFDTVSTPPPPGQMERTSMASLTPKQHFKFKMQKSSATSPKSSSHQLNTDKGFNSESKFSIDEPNKVVTKQRHRAPSAKPMAIESEDEDEYGDDDIGEDLYIATTRRPPIQPQQLTSTTRRIKAQLPRAQGVPLASFVGDNEIVGVGAAEGQTSAADKIARLIPNVKIKSSMRPFLNGPMAALPPPIAIPHSTTEKSNEESVAVDETAEDDDKMVERLPKEMQQQQAQLVRITPPKVQQPQKQQMVAQQQFAVPQTSQAPIIITTQQPTEEPAEQPQQPVEQQQQVQLLTTATPQIPDAPRDSQGRPLVLSPEHCKMVDRYSRLYGVQDVRAFVRNNCAFAKLYLPTATCAEIDVLVGSCYSPSRTADQLQKRKRMAKS